MKGVVSRTTRVLIRAGALAMLTGPALGLDLPPDTDAAFAEAYKACVAASVSGGLLPAELGWTTHDTGDVDASAWGLWLRGFATRDVPGVGGMDLSAKLEKYPGFELGTCTIRIDHAERSIAAPALAHISGFTGTLEGDPDNWSGLWRTDDGTLFIHALMNSDATRFTLSLTNLKPSTEQLVSVYWRGKPVFMHQASKGEDQ